MAENDERYVNLIKINQDIKKMSQIIFGTNNAQALQQRFRDVSQLQDSAQLVAQFIINNKYNQVIGQYSNMRRVINAIRFRFLGNVDDIQSDRFQEPRINNVQGIQNSGIWMPLDQYYQRTGRFNQVQLDTSFNLDQAVINRLQNGVQVNNYVSLYISQQYGERIVNNPLLGENLQFSNNFLSTFTFFFSNFLPPLGNFEVIRTRANMNIPQFSFGTQIHLFMQKLKLNYAFILSSKPMNDAPEIQNSVVFQQGQVRNRRLLVGLNFNNRSHYIVGTQFDMAANHNGDYKQNMLSLDQQLFSMGISSTTFAMCYAFSCIFLYPFMDKPDAYDYNMLFAIQIAYEIKDSLVQSNIDQIFSEFNQIYKYRFINDNNQQDQRLVQIDNQMHNYITNFINDNQLGSVLIPQFEGGSFYFEPIFEFSYLLNQRPQDNNQVAYKDSMRQMVNLTRQQLLDFSNSAMLQQLDDYFANNGNIIYQQFNDTVKYAIIQFYNATYETVRQNQDIDRIDVFIDMLLMYDQQYDKRAGKLNIPLNEAELIYDQYKAYISVRFSIPLVRVNPWFQTREQFVQEFISEMLKEYTRHMNGYGFIDLDENLEDNQLQQYLFSYIKRITFKPLFWLKRQRDANEAESVQARNQRQYNASSQLINRIPIDLNGITQSNVNENLRLYGFSTYNEFLMDILFAHPDYTYFINEYPQLTKLNCIQKLMYFLIQIKQEYIIDQWVPLIFGDINHMPIDQDCSNYQALLQQKNYQYDLECLRAFINYNSIVIDIIDRGILDKHDRPFIYIEDNHCFIANQFLLNSDTRQYAIKNRYMKIDKISLEINKPKYIDIVEKNKKCPFFTKTHFVINPNTIENDIEIKTQFDIACVYKNSKMEAVAFFDFETTHYLDPFRQNKLCPKNENAKDQTPFCVSYKLYLSLNFTDYLAFFFNDESKLKSVIAEYDIKDINIQPLNGEVIFGLNCENQLIEILNNVQQQIQDQVVKVNEIIIKLSQEDKHLKSVTNLEKYLLDSKLYVMSYNGAKFDNHPILNAIKKKHPLNWHQKTQIVGNLSNIKVLQYGNIWFYDLLLMTGAGCSLAKLAETMQCQQLKIDYDIVKNASTWEIAQQNQQDIMNYCQRDGDVLHEIFNKFRDTMSDIIKLYHQDIFGELKEKLDYYGFQVKDFLMKDLKIWPTISSLSLTIFKKYFLKQSIHGASNEKAYQQMKNSYFGGYTQSFWIGKNIDKEQIYYLDFNSMYPAVMASLKIPVNFQKSEYKQFIQLKKVQSAQEWAQYLNVQMDDNFKKNPLELDDQGDYSLFHNISDYDLFTVVSFKFKDNVFFPSIPVRSKTRGTIYPLEFTVSDDNNVQDQQKDGITLFGFQIRELFNQDKLDQIIIKGRTYIACTEIHAFFKDFDIFLYNERLKCKKTNPVLAQCIKILLNSLYGKFGQAFFPVNFILNEAEYENKLMLLNMIKDAIKDKNDINIDSVRENPVFNQMFKDMQININPINDAQITPLKHYFVQVENAPRHLNKIGSGVYIASIITAMSRLKIMEALDSSLLNGQNSYDPNGARVFYCDTDSLIVNKQAYLNLSMNKNIKIHDSELGALKDEYPNDVITDIYIINKKLYAVKKGDEWKIKFKGIRNGSMYMFQSFKKYGGVNTTDVRFIKKFGCISIIQQFYLQMHAILARKIQNNNNLQQQQTLESNSTEPFKNLQECYNAYKDKTGVFFNQNTLQWQPIYSQYDDKKKQWDIKQ